MSAFNVFKGRCRSFTVVELLVVVAIMGMVLTTALPGFLRMVGGGAVSTGATGVSSQLRFCRSYALSKNQYVALIIPDRYSLPKENNNIHRCYRAAVVQHESSSSGSNFMFKYWLPDSTWAMLATKSYVDFLQDTPCTVSRVDFSTLGGREQGDAEAIVYKPSGRPVGTVGSKIGVVIGEGFVEDGKINDKGSMEQNKLLIVLDSNTGRVDVVEAN